MTARTLLSGFLPDSIQSRNALRLGLVRTLWIAMIVGHLPAFIDSVGDLIRTPAQGLARFGFLTLSILFFSLCAYDSRWLRLPASRRSWLTIAIVIGLLHAGPLQRCFHVDVDLGDGGAAPAVLVIGAAGLAVFRLVSCRISHKRPTSDPVRSHQNRVKYLVDQLEIAVHRSELLALCTLATGHRAPPSR